MAKKKNNFGTYLLGFLLATLVVGVASKIELPTSNNSSSNKTSDHSSLNSISSSVDELDNYLKVFESIDLNGDISTYSQFNMTRGSYMYQNGTYFENSLIKKLVFQLRQLMIIQRIMY